MSSDRSASERRGAARTAVVWGALHPVLDGDGHKDVLDIGGGTGGFAVRVAELGHRVVVVDPSPDALAALGRRAQERGVPDRVTGHQGDASSLLDVVAPGSADVVLCHGVLEYVDDPAAALASIAEVLRPGGTLSLLVSQRHAAVIARAMAGHFQQARALLDDDTIGAATSIGGRGTGRRFTRDELLTLLPAAGFTLSTIHGVRVFADLVPGSLLDLEPGAAAALVDLEQAVAERPEFLPLATQLHVVARR
ncbi:class I SAM-dependent methyltransferase [Nocardioides sp.]|uniref:class I SAM-dependent methyltransferase n=1 Tax=Nocardioides sp. TaxID=35761 RepID=UPI003D124ACE